jgi:hypothetical protein
MIQITMRSLASLFLILVLFGSFGLLMDAGWDIYQGDTLPVQDYTAPVLDFIYNHLYSALPVIGIGLILLGWFVFGNFVRGR